MGNQEVAELLDSACEQSLGLGEPFFQTLRHAIVDAGELLEQQRFAGLGLGPQRATRGP